MTQPLSPAGARSKPVHLRLSPELLASVDRSAERLDLNRSEFIRLAIEKGRLELATEELAATAEGART